MAAGPDGEGLVPRVTVIICTYDRPDNLKRCLESVRGQDYPAFDVLVVARPSADGDAAPEKIAAGFGARLVRQEGAGIANARNQGLRAATADYIAFIDDDCTAAPDWLRKLMETLRRTGASGASGTALTGGTDAVEFANGTVDVYGRGRCRNPAPGGHDRPGGRVFNNIVCMNVAFRRPDVLAVGGFDEYFNHFYEETDLGVRMIQAGHRIVHEPGAVVRHWPTAQPGRQSRSLYNISRNTTYMPLKNFRGDELHRRVVLRWLCYRRMLTFLGPLARGEISAGTYVQYCRDIGRGFRDGMRDGLRAGGGRR